MIRRPDHGHPADADDYFYRRAETELSMAEKATSPAVVRAHYELANLYLERLTTGDEHGEQIAPESIVR